MFIIKNFERRVIEIIDVQKEKFTCGLDRFNDVTCNRNCQARDWARDFNY